MGQLIMRVLLIFGQKEHKMAMYGGLWWAAATAKDADVYEL